MHICFFPRPSTTPGGLPEELAAAGDSLGGPPEGLAAAGDISSHLGMFFTKASVSACVCVSVCIWECVFF